VANTKIPYQSTNSPIKRGFLTENDYSYLTRMGKTQDEIDRILDLVIETGVYSIGLNSENIASIRNRSFAWLGVNPFKKERE
jgi:hypothetical protein